MYIVQRQILKVVNNWSITSTALATLARALYERYSMSFLKKRGDIISS